MKPNQKLKLSKKVQVKNMFDSISAEYDLLNRIMTFGNDIRWRKKIYKIAKSDNPKDILDIATGTADIALELSKITESSIIGLDISEQMLEVGRKKINNKKLSNKVVLISGDAENLDYEKESFDLVTIGFGVRNFENLEKGLKESHRVLRSRGKLIILETSVPENSIIKFFYFFFSRSFIPLIGSLFSKDKTAYQYLQKSAEKFPSGKNFILVLNKCGFSNVKVQTQMFGATSIYIAKK
ncbi:bifunctional demethylmenaquinone methyltransferase/2-methoxy-6-polyprenyl-1,4-benzoquinol methylase UbiE [Flavobacteriaceae bacterium]|jgi:demethylmenaquinone methyltransferase/2-methoxy-6-polyprenyl-1,4-benzoquinol methylase|nr:bifunctional demethylmenaquinone methyltransferase/2-methoxy-6-polyprenyl-1,4-benzoquinol methylase UbiE [Flavobacteriaceae bacterium]|tara:strand:- start:15709 stop:16425 length:717 start_codon:yes stop_codon:yes gene_type:complete